MTDDPIKAIQEGVAEYRNIQGEASVRQVAAARRLYAHVRLDVVKWSAYASELDRIIDELLGRTNPYFSDE